MREHYIMRRRRKMGVGESTLIGRNVYEAIRFFSVMGTI